MRECKIAGCGKHVSGRYSTLCANHSKIKARHGHPLQKSVRRHELKPYEKAVRNWLKTRSSARAWPILKDRWYAMLRDANIYLDRPANGRPYQTHVLRAAQTIQTIENEGKAREAIIRLLAMGYLKAAYGKRFQSERAFQFQTARQFRSLTDVNVGITWDQKTNKPKRVYRDVPPRVLQALWNRLDASDIPLYGAQIGNADLEEQKRLAYRPEEARRAILGNMAAVHMEAP